ncbi:hypothetical protein PCE1_002012 [Barthelona sp. PCE]
MSLTERMDRIGEVFTKALDTAEESLINSAKHLVVDLNSEKTNEVHQQLALGYNSSHLHSLKEAMACINEIATLASSAAGE